MAKKPRSAAWHLYLTAVVPCCAVGYALYAQWRALPHEEPPPEPVVAEELPPAPASSARQFADAFYEEVDRALEARGLWPALIRKERGEIDRIYVQVPADLPLSWRSTQRSHWPHRHTADAVRAQSKRSAMCR